MVIPDSLQIFGLGMVLGFSIAAPPGPINATIASQLAKSWVAGFLVGLGALTADAIFFFITFFGVTRAIANNGMSPALFLLGGAMMLWMCFATIRRARTSVRPGGARQNRFPYVLGLSIGITNPFQIAWWLTVGVGVMATFGLRILAGFFSGITAWLLIFTSALTWAMAKYYRVSPIVTYTSAAILGVFGVWFLSTALIGLL